MEAESPPRGIPGVPDALRLPIEQLWNGEPPPRPELRAWVELSATESGIRVSAGMPHQRPPRVPEAPVGARFERLWEYDVVECFLAAADGRYLELELGAGGHYLALAFTAPRVPDPGFAAGRLAIAWSADAAGWRASCELPRAWIPEPLARANAFAIGGGHFLAWHPVPGAQPDFHQPGAYPAVRAPRGWVTSGRGSSS